MPQTGKNEQQIPRLQVALDFKILDEALAISKEVTPFADILEAGTPLIITLTLLKLAEKLEFLRF